LNEIEYALISLKPSLLLKLPIYLLQSEVLKDIEHSGVTFGTGSVLHRILGFHMTSSKLKNKEELSILLSIYFHLVLKQLKKFSIFTKFRLGRGFCLTMQSQGAIRPSLRRNGEATRVARVSRSSSRDGQWICAVTKVAVFDFFDSFRNKFGTISELNSVFSASKVFPADLTGALKKRGGRGGGEKVSFCNKRITSKEQHPLVHHKPSEKQVSSDVTRNTTMIPSHYTITE